MRFLIDGEDPPFDPVTIDVIPPGRTNHPLPDGRVVVMGDSGGKVNVTVNWGLQGNPMLLLRWLDEKRRMGPLHEIAFEDLFCERLAHINAIIPDVQRNYLGYSDDRGREIVNSELSLTFTQTDPAICFVMLRFTANGTIAVADGIYKHQAPGAGRFLSVEGWIDNLGTVGGQTRIQLSCGGVDYLSTRGDFVVGGSHRLVNQVLIADPTFIKGDILELDVDTIPGGADSADAEIFAWCEMFCGT